jgi:flagellar biosynthetic protein FliO
MTPAGLLQSSRIVQKLARLPAWMWVAGLLAVFGLAILAAGTQAQPTAEQMVSGAQMSSAGLGVDIFLKLVLVLLLIYASVYALRKFQVGASGGTVKRLRVLETAHLSPRQKIHLVQIGSQVILIGATDQNLSFLTDVEIQAQDAEQPMLEQPGGTAGNKASAGFAGILASTFMKRS